MHQSSTVERILSGSRSSELNTATDKRDLLRRARKQRKTKPILRCEDALVRCFLHKLECLCRSTSCSLAGNHRQVSTERRVRQQRQSNRKWSLTSVCQGQVYRKMYWALMQCRKHRTSRFNLHCIKWRILNDIIHFSAYSVEIWKLSFAFCTQCVRTRYPSYFLRIVHNFGWYFPNILHTAHKYGTLLP